MNTGNSLSLLSWVKEMYSEDTGGGFVCDILVLADDRVVVISEESIVLYKDLESWESGSRDQLGVIYR